MWVYKNAWGSELVGHLSPASGLGAGDPPGRHQPCGDTTAARGLDFRVLSCSEIRLLKMLTKSVLCN